MPRRGPQDGRDVRGAHPRRVRTRPARRRRLRASATRPARRTLYFQRRSTGIWIAARSTWRPASRQMKATVSVLPPPDLTNVFGPEAYWLGRIRRRYQLWGDRWREVKTCPVCWDALPEAETTGGSLGRSEQKDLRLCSHVKDVCVECVRSFCRAQLGDVAKITGEGLPCVESTCSAPLTLAALEPRTPGGEHGAEHVYALDPLLTTDGVKARRSAA